MSQFAGFSKDTFSVYVPEKWSSNVHNLPRMRNKDLMVAVCDAAIAGLSTELAGLTRATSDEIPNIVNQKRVEAQWVYWYRDAASRATLASFLEKTPLDQTTFFNIAPQDKHVTLAVVLKHTELWIGLRMAAGAVVDRRNLASKLSQSWERERLLSIVQALPAGALLGFENAPTLCSEMDLEKLTAFTDKLVPGQPTWQVYFSIPAEEVVARGTAIVDDVTLWLRALAPLYRFTAWTRDNDLIEAGKQLQEEKAQKRRQATAFHPGDRVRFVAGLFSGKLGVVQETDTKAQVKVRVGKMSVVVPGTDLTAAS